MQPLGLERGGVQVTLTGAQLGPSLLRLEDLAAPIPPKLPEPGPLPVFPDWGAATPTPPPVVVDLTAVTRSLDRLHRELVALRGDLERRSLEGRWRRVVAWVRRLMTR